MFKILIYGGYDGSGHVVEYPALSGDVIIFKTEGLHTDGYQIELPVGSTVVVTMESQHYELRGETGSHIVNDYSGTARATPTHDGETFQIAFMGG